MALTATVHVFAIDLADSDRGVYETLDLRVAKHPSESSEHLVARLLAYCLEYTDGIEFSKGLSHPDEPAIAIRDLTGVLRAWIDIGSPDAARLHRASKSVARVAVYTHKDATQWLRSLEGERIHHVETLELYGIDRALIAALAAKLERRMEMAIAVSGGDVYISLAAETITGSVRRLTVA